MSATPVSNAVPSPTDSDIRFPRPHTTGQEDLDDLQSSLVTTAITVAVAFGVLLWDYFVLFPTEFNLYRMSSKSLLQRPIAWAFILLRYSGILATFPPLFLTSIQNKHCQATAVISQIGLVLVVASSGMIFASRVLSIWGNHKVIMATVGVTYLFMLGSWCAVASQVHAATGPPVSFGSNCQLLPAPSLTPLGYSSLVAFDTLIFSLIVFKFNSHRTFSSSEDRNTIYHGSLMYILITAVTNIAVLAIQTLDSRHDLIKAAAVPFSTVITATMGARVFRDLTTLNRPKKQPAPKHEALPFPATTNTRTGQNSNRSNLSLPRPSASTLAPRVDLPMQPFSIDLGVMNNRPDTPFASYDYDPESPNDDKNFLGAHFTRETVVVVE